MNVHEYQAKEILAESGVTVQRGITASNTDQAFKAAVKLTEDTGTKTVIGQPPRPVKEVTAVI